MKIEFTEVGRNKNSFDITVEDNLSDKQLYDALYNAAKTKGGLMSDIIEFTEDGFVIVGGFRPVGKYKIIK